MTRHTAGPMSGQGITVTAPDGVPEVRKGDDLAALLLTALDSGL
jgi:coenzyme F420-0:L-glutamate ligase/coenzyme F420-1:gamma-L-glutamate ligase